MSFALSKAIASSKVFLIPSNKLEQRWDPNYFRWMKVFRARIKQCPHPIERLKPSLSLVQYGISERATEEPVGVPMLRMINLQSDTWDISDMKYIAMSDEEKTPYLLRRDDILFNRTNSKELVGKCCVFNLPGEYVFASYLIRVRLNQRRLLPDYVTAYLASPIGRIQIDAVSRQIAGMTNINAEEIRDLLIPVPSPAVQEQVAKAWRQAIRRRDQTLADARTLLAQVDDRVLNTLGVTLAREIPHTLKDRVFVRRFNTLSGRRFDAPANWKRLSFAGGRFPMRNFRDVCLINPPTQPPKLDALEPVSFVPMEAVSETHGEITDRQVRPLGECKSYTTFQNRDLIWAKITPCMENGKSAIAQNLIGGFGFGSTEFHVFRPKTKELSVEYIHLLFRLGVLRNHARLFFGGSSGHQRVDELFFHELEIPVPSVEDQKQLVRQAKEIKERAQKLFDNAAKELEQSKREIEALIIGLVNHI